jgi:hypothetical protein
MRLHIYRTASRQVPAVQDTTAGCNCNEATATDCLQSQAIKVITKTLMQIVMSGTV